MHTTNFLSGSLLWQIARIVIDDFVNIIIRILVCKMYKFFGFFIVFSFGRIAKQIINGNAKIFCNSSLSAPGTDPFLMLSTVAFDKPHSSNILLTFVPLLRHSASIFDANSFKSITFFTSKSSLAYRKGALLFAQIYKRVNSNFNKNHIFKEKLLTFLNIRIII